MAMTDVACKCRRISGCHLVQLNQVTAGNTSAFAGYISHSHCEISDDVMVLIWNFLWDIYGHD